MTADCLASLTSLGHNLPIFMMNKICWHNSYLQIPRSQMTIVSIYQRPNWEKFMQVWFSNIFNLASQGCKSERDAKDVLFGHRVLLYSRCSCQGCDNTFGSSSWLWTSKLAQPQNVPHAVIRILTWTKRHTNSYMQYCINTYTRLEETERVVQTARFICKYHTKTPHN